MTIPSAFLGLDFGTTNASLSYLLDDPRLATERIVRARDVLFEVDPESGQQSARVPTLLARDPEDPEGGSALTGWRCWQHLRHAARDPNLLRHGVDYFRSVKSDLGHCRVYRKAFAPRFTTPEVVVGQIFEDLLREALEQIPGASLPDISLTLSVPAALSEAARRATLTAAEMAGLEPDQVDLIDEPTAALIDLLSAPDAAGLLGREPKTLALYDYGGGTLDVTLVRACFDPDTRTGLRVHTLAIPPYARLGGDVVDQAVMDEVVWPQIFKAGGLEADEVTLDLKQAVEDTFAPWVARGLKEALCRKALQQRRRHGAAASGDLEVSFRVPRDPDGDEDEPWLAQEFLMDSREFQRLLAPLVYWTGPGGMGRADLRHPPLLEPLIAALDIGRIDPTDLDFIVLHGGGCRNPYVLDLLETFVTDAGGLFRHTELRRTPDLDASVARGAAISGYWKHARGETYIVPVIPEEIGVITLSDRPVKLVDGGEPLPYPEGGGVATAETVFAVPVKGLCTMLVPFYAGRERPCRLVGTIPVDLPPGLDQGDVVRLCLRIDADKVLHWWTSVDGGPFLKHKPLCDPWAPEAPTGAARKLLELRRDIRKKLVGFGRVDATDVLQEVGLLLDCGEPKEADLLLMDHGGVEDHLKGRWHNLKALISAACGDPETSIAHANEAVHASPGNAVLLGNFGINLGRMGRTEEGIARCRAALGKRPELLYVRSALADLYRSKGDEASAEKELREGLVVAKFTVLEDPESVGALKWLATFHHALGDYEEGREASARAGIVEKSALYGGDPRHRIAGPDSGYVRIEDLG